MNTIFNKMSVADMYIKVTQYDKMQRAFVGASPQLRVISSLCFEVCIIRYINQLCVCFYMTTLFSLVASVYNLKINFTIFARHQGIWYCPVENALR